MAGRPLLPRDGRQIARVKVLLTLKAAGFSLDEIRQLLLEDALLICALRAEEERELREWSQETSSQ